MDKVISRRSAINLGLRAVAGAGLLGSAPGAGLVSDLSGGVLAAPRWQRRSLVCLYCFGGGDDQILAAPQRLNDSLNELQPLYDRKVLAVIDEVRRPARTRTEGGTPGDVMARRYSGLRFLQDGFVTLEWAARAADVDGLTGKGAYTFNTGVSLVAPTVRIPGPSFENATIRHRTDRLAPLRTAFPKTALGRQLEDVTRLLRVAPTLGMHDQVFFVGTTGMSRSAAKAGTLSVRHRELGRAMAAFFAATVELGLESQVTTYTDGDFTERSGDTGTRMVLGGAVNGGDACRIRRVSQDSFAGAMATWLGAGTTMVQAGLPEFEPTAVTVMA